MQKGFKWIMRVLSITVMCILLMIPGNDASAAQLIVDHNVPLEAGEYMERVEGYSFDVSDYHTVKEYDKFILKADANIYISENFVQTMSELMDIIEETTGLSFMPKKSPVLNPNYETEKVVIDISYSRMTEFGSTIQSASEGCVYLLAENAMLGELSFDYNTPVHELLHVIQMRNYGFLGNIVTEGYAESLTGTIEKKLRKKYGNLVATDERLNEISSINAYGINECGLDVDYNTDWVTRDNIEEYFFLNPGHTGHETSYWIIEYIREKYKDKGLRKVMNALGKKSAEYLATSPKLANLTNDMELEVIKETLSQTFVDDFYDWFKKQDTQDNGVSELFDLTDIKKVDAGYGAMLSFNGNPYYEYPSNFTYKDSLEIDFSKVIAHSQQFLATRYKGFVGYFFGEGDVSFYDQYGTLLYSFSVQDDWVNNGKSVRVPYATKVVISSPGTHNMSIYGIADVDFFSDTVFDNVTCTDGRTVTFDEITQEKKATKPINRKVKTAKELTEALENSIGVGGKITVTGNVTTTDSITIPSNTQVVIKKGKKLTVKDTDIDVYGSVSGNVVFDGGWMWLEENATWKNGKVTYSTKVRKDYDLSLGYGCGVRLNQGSDGKLTVLFGLYNRLYVDAPSGKDLSSLLEFTDLRDKFTLYFNGKKVSAKKLKKLSF